MIEVILQGSGGDLVHKFPLTVKIETTAEWVRVNNPDGTVAGLYPNNRVIGVRCRVGE